MSQVVLLSCHIKIFWVLSQFEFLDNLNCRVLSQFEFLSFFCGNLSVFFCKKKYKKNCEISIFYKKKFCCEMIFLVKKVFWWKKVLLKKTIWWKKILDEKGFFKRNFIAEFQRFFNTFAMWPYILNCFATQDNAGEKFVVKKMF